MLSCLAARWPQGSSVIRTGVTTLGFSVVGAEMFQAELSGDAGVDLHYFCYPQPSFHYCPSFGIPEWFSACPMSEISHSTLSCMKNHLLHYSHTHLITALFCHLLSSVQVTSWAPIIRDNSTHLRILKKIMCLITGTGTW